ncbi:plant basic secretory protein [Saccharata proteae CBS 121410]|uniref:Plant basic secretory protein n=1 Tax=Saccharata proteae CBS 121410 TaxID=1314787 RepID=A0A6A5YF71_9PEZI|nr:plant basic secretory protein [Saccharata proteae CBS 121410]
MTPAPSPTASRPKPKRKPLLRLELRDLAQVGTRSFLSLLDCATVIDEAVAGVLQHLYSAHAEIPPVRSITLILRPMPGVAYTTGLDIDNDHKEIHFSTDYIASIPLARRQREMLGVLRHEMVHCWQWNARGTAPGGLIEGIADYVRLRSGFVPPHWKQEADGDWDAGYQHTAYFLNYLEERFGAGTVMGINETLRDKEYDEAVFWKALFGKGVKELWSDYGKTLKKPDDGDNAKTNTTVITDGPGSSTPAGAA